MIETILSNLITIVLSFLGCLVVMYIKRPMENNVEHLFITIIEESSERYNNKYWRDKIDLYKIIAEVDYGIKIWRSNEETEKYNTMVRRWDVALGTNPIQKAEYMTRNNYFPERQCWWRRFKIFLKLWFKARDDAQNVYNYYFSLCSFVKRI